MLDITEGYKVVSVRGVIPSRLGPQGHFVALKCRCMTGLVLGGTGDPNEGGSRSFFLLSNPRSRPPLLVFIISQSNRLTKVHVRNNSRTKLS
jgi:hypothetical protein